jgi:hyperosmotically inducible periplasmic protein
MSPAKRTRMKKGWQGLGLAIMLGGSLFFSACTTEQRGGRSTGQYIDDKTLNSKVRSALDDSAEYKFPDVKVETFRGTVQLSGFVVSGPQKARASEIAKNVSGVQSVENKITIK